VAGLASTIKAALALQQRVLPPTLGIDKPNTRIDWSQSPFYLNTETRPWLPRADGSPRRAGVSSFGFGGTNFHVVLEEYSPDRPVARAGRRGAGGGPDASGPAGENIRTPLTGRKNKLLPAETKDLAGLAAALLHEESSRTASDRRARLAIIAGSIEDLRQKV